MPRIYFINYNSHLCFSLDKIGTILCSALLLLISGLYIYQQAGTDYNKTIYDLHECLVAWKRRAYNLRHRNRTPWLNAVGGTAWIEINLG
jgi:hypothetical protein